MKKYLPLLIFLLSSLTITGISFIDDKIWDIIVAGMGVLAYAIVGMMYSFGLLKSKSDGVKAYVFILILLIIGGFAVYQGLMNFQAWILTWPLLWKILVPIVLGLMTIGALILVIIHWNDCEDYYD